MFRVRRTRNKGVNELHFVCPLSCQQSQSLNWGAEHTNFQKQPPDLGTDVQISHMTRAFRSLHPTDFMGTEPVQKQKTKVLLFTSKGRESGPICNQFRDAGGAEKLWSRETPGLCPLWKDLCVGSWWHEWGTDWMGGTSAACDYAAFSHTRAGIWSECNAAVCTAYEWTEKLCLMCLRQ